MKNNVLTGTPKLSTPPPCIDHFGDGLSQSQVRGGGISGMVVLPNLVKHRPLLLLDLGRIDSEVFC